MHSLETKSWFLSTLNRPSISKQKLAELPGTPIIAMLSKEIPKKLLSLLYL